MIKSLSIAAVLLVSSSAHALTRGPSSVGATAGSAEIIGGYFSTYVSPDVTLDLKAGAALASVGVSGHIPFAEFWSVLLNASGGYAYNAVHSDWPAYRGWHLGAMAGVGFERKVDLRLQGGIITGPLQKDGGWGVYPQVNFMVGYIF